MQEEMKNTLHMILAGVLVNGYMQGEKGQNLDIAVLEEATKEINKLIKGE